ncbi:MAG: zinc ribbon domain-containing protein [Clostridia bacterium]|nr:zinc ribbon domain-containing protein [Clostridia bacterium]
MKEFLFCSNCGTRISTDSKFCFSCGKKIKNQDLEFDVKEKSLHDNFKYQSEGSIENIARISQDLHEQYYNIISEKIIESYINNLTPPLENIYQSGIIYGFDKNKVDNAIEELEQKIDMFVKYLEGLYINGSLLMLDISDSVIYECTNFALGLGFIEEDANLLYRHFLVENKIREKNSILVEQLSEYQFSGNIDKIDKYKDIFNENQINNDSFYIRFENALLELEKLQVALHEQSHSLELNDADKKKMYEKGISLGFREFDMIDQCIDGAEEKNGYAMKALKQKNEKMFSSIIPTKTTKIFGTDIVFDCHYFFEDYIAKKLTDNLHSDRLKFVATIDKATKEENLKNNDFDLDIDEWGIFIRRIWKNNIDAFINSLPISKGERTAIFEEINVVFDTKFDELQDNLDDVSKIIEAIDAGVEITELEGKMRKAFRGSWSGGGYGVKGAVAGAITASALNVGSGLVYDAVNAISASNAKHKAVKQKAEILRNTVKEISDFLNIVFTHTPAVMLNTIKDMYPFSCFFVDKNEVNNLYENYIVEAVDETKRSMALELLLMDPKDDLPYMLIIDLICSEYESERSEDINSIIKISQWFGLDIEKIKSKIIKDISERYNIDDIRRCDKLLEVETLLGAAKETEREEILGGFIRHSEITNFNQYSVDELNSVISNILEFGSKYLYSVETDKKKRIEEYIDFHIKNILKEYSYSELESVFKYIDYAAQTVGYQSESIKQKIFEDYVDYHLKEDIQELSMKNIDLLVEHINWVNTKYSYDISAAKGNILKRICEHYNIDLNSENESVLEENINKLKSLDLDCAYDFSEIIKQQKLVLSKLIEKKDIQSRTVEGVIYETVEEAKVASQEMQIILKICNNDSISKVEKYNKLLQHQFLTGQAQLEVEKYERLLIKHISYCKNHISRKSSLGWFVLYLLLTPLFALIGSLFGGIGLIIAFIVIIGTWISYAEKFKETKEYNEDIVENKAEINMFNHYFKLDNDRIKKKK